jgi:hypothetical protein
LDYIAELMYPMSELNLSRSEQVALNDYRRERLDQINVYLAAIHRLHYEVNTAMGLFDKGKKTKGANTAIALLSAYDDTKLIAAVMTVVNAGHVIQFSGTRAGNALVVGIYDGKENSKAYPETVEDLDAVIETIMEEYGASYEEAPTPPPAKGIRAKGRRVNSQD